MAMQSSNQLTMREIQQMEYDKQMWEAQAAHQLALKQLEVRALEMESKWTSWFKIPLTIITLPVRVLMVIPMTVYAVTHQEVPEFYHRFYR